MDFLLSTIEQYGIAVYLLLFVYCMVKSGSLPIFAAIAASSGVLNVALVSAVVFAGGFLGDELRFFWVRRYGDAFIQRRPRLKRAANTAAKLLEHYGTAYLFFYRYPKGLRTVGAVPLALTSISKRRFTLLNAGSALVWTSSLMMLGYALGQLFIDHAEQYWGWLSLGLLVLFFTCSWLAWWRLKQGVADDTAIAK